MLRRGVLRRICLLINEHCNLDLPPPPSPKMLNSFEKQQQRHSVDVTGIENNTNLTNKKEEKLANELLDETRESRKKFIVGNNKSGKLGSRRSSTQQAKGTTINGNSNKQPPRKRPGSAESAKAKGVGYGRGSTKSRWK